MCEIISEWFLFGGKDYWMGVFGGKIIISERKRLKIRNPRLFLLEFLGGCAIIWERGEMNE